MNLDRSKQTLAAFVVAQLPGIDFLAEYGGRVIAQGGANAFDFQPDDPRIPGMSGIPCKLPFPGFSFTLDESANPRANLGWADGNPAQPELRLWEVPGLSTWQAQAGQSATLAAPAVNLGSASASHPLVLGDDLVAATNALVEAWTQFQTATTQIAQALTSYAQGIQPNADPGPAPSTKQFVAAVGTFEEAIAQMDVAITEYQTAVDETLSAVSKTV